MRLNKHIHLVTKENDIKYRGPLSYRHFRIFGWIMMAFAQAAVICAACVKYWASSTTHNLTAISTFGEIFNSFGQLAIPLFLLANFAIILQSGKNIKRLIIMHATCAIALYLLFILIYERYLCGLAYRYLGGPDAKVLVDTVVSIFFSKNLSFNVFIDLLMCSSLYFFLSYKPSLKCFEGKKIYIFRSMAALPIMYEIACLLIKGLALGENMFTLPVEVISLMTSKPVFTFAAFIVIVVFMKRRQNLYHKRKGAKLQYEEFLETNTNSLHFSIFIAIVFTIAAILDAIMLGILTGVYINKHPEMDFSTLKAIKNITIYAKCWGIGNATTLILATPLVLLFSYTKRYSKESKFIDILIPLIGIGICAFIYIEGFYDLIVLK